MTQAIAAWEMLSRSGHELADVIAGHNATRELPDFFANAFPVPITTLPSPGFTFAGHRGVHLGATAWDATRRAGEWRRSVRALRRRVEASRPDLIINFFEPLTGITQAIRPLPAPVLAVGHQFTLLGPRWVGLRDSPVGPWWLNGFVRLVGCRSWKLALSFRPPDFASRNGVVVSPPLLRDRVHGLRPASGDHVLVYLLNHGYADQLRTWLRRRPDILVHCFYDRPGAPPVEVAEPNLTFHRLDGTKFLRMMASCRAVMCTAGFESVCEAAFLGKPVLMTPVEHHLEQQLNARDAEQSGVGRHVPGFDVAALDTLDQGRDPSWFRTWCQRAESVLMETIEQIGGPADGAQRRSKGANPVLERQAGGRIESRMSTPAGDRVPALQNAQATSNAPTERPASARLNT